MAEVKASVLLEFDDRTAQGVSSATSNLARLETKTSQFGNTVKQMPEKLSKVGAGLTLLGGQLGNAGGQFGQVATKATGLAAIIATGGPLGVAMAALGLAVAGASKAWEIYNAEAKNTEEAIKALTPIIEAQNQRIKQQEIETKSAQEALANFGKTASQIAEIENRNREVILARYKAEREAIIARNTTIGGTLILNEANARLLEDYDRWIKLSETLISKTKEEAKAKDELAKKQSASRTTQGASGNQDTIRLAEITKAVNTNVEAMRAMNFYSDEGKRFTEELTRALQDQLSVLAAKGGLTNENVQATRDLIEATNEEIKAAKDADAIIAKRQATLNDFSVFAQGARDAEAIARDAEIAARNEQFERELALMQEKYDATVRYATAAGQVWGAAMVQVIADSKNAGKILVNSAIETANRVIQIYAAEAAVKSASVGATFGFVGAAAMAAATFALLKGYVNKYALGGMVTGGTAGRDSVPAMLTPGERVLTVQQARDYAANSSTGGNVINLNVSNNLGIQNPSEFTDAQLKNMVLRMAPQVEELVRDGLYLRELARR